MGYCPKVGLPKLKNKMKLVYELVIIVIMAAIGHLRWVYCRVTHLHLNGDMFFFAARPSKAMNKYSFVIYELYRLANLIRAINQDIEIYFQWYVQF